MEVVSGSFCWDEFKEDQNILKHDVCFIAASKAFFDPSCSVFKDDAHSSVEERWFCIGMVDGRPMTVRFTYRDQRIRIIGAGYWRSRRRYYYEK